MLGDANHGVELLVPAAGGEQEPVPGECSCTHLSHMSKMKRQKEPTAMGPTCFQYPERRFRSFWS